MSDSLELLKVLMADSRAGCAEEDKLGPLVHHPDVHESSQGRPVVVRSLCATLSFFKHSPRQDIENNF